MNFSKAFQILIILSSVFSDSALSIIKCQDSHHQKNVTSLTHFLSKDFVSKSNILYNITENMFKNVSSKSFRDYFQYAFKMSFKKDITITITILLSIISIIGSILNLLVLIVFTLRDDCMEVDGNTTYQLSSEFQNKRRQSNLAIAETTITINKVSSKSKNKRNSTNPIYLLIKYLAFVDFLTCFLVIPVIIYEMWFLSSSNEILCKSFELLRGTGVNLSNFLVILISFERFMLLCKPFSFYRFKNVLFKRLLIIITLLSFLIGSIAMLQTSVYQLDENGQITFTSICLPSDVTLSNELRATINLTIVYMILASAVFVGFLHIFIFRAAFRLNQKRVDRIRVNEKMFSNAYKYSSGKFEFNCNLSSIETQRNNQELINNYDAIASTSLIDFVHDGCPTKKSKSFLLKSKIGLYKSTFTIFKSNMRIAFMIFFVTLSYYVSVIPWSLIRNGIIKFNLFIYYTFLLKNLLNPVIYGFFNPNFRRYCFEILNDLIYFNYNKKQKINKV